MSQEVLCWVYGDDPKKIFQVKVEMGTTVAHLKKTIKAETDPQFQNVEAHTLNLWKTSVAKGNMYGILGCVDLNSLEDFDQLRPMDLLTGVFSDPAVDDHIHIIIVQHRGNSSNSGRRISGYIPIDNSPYTPRTETVTGIYEKLHQYKYIQVRGPPASGKTTLANLLHEYMLKHEPEALVAHISAWLPQGKMPPRGWRSWLSSRWSFQPGSVLIVDNAQTSYWDQDFWLALKAIRPEWDYRVITFASYGSASQVLWGPMAPFRISLRQSVSLTGVDNGDQIAVGLLLTKYEFDAFVEKVFVDHRFHNSFLEIIFDMTNGHVGACEALLRVVLAHGSYRSVKNQGGQYTYDDFITRVHMTELLQDLSTHGIFRKGVPDQASLQSSSVAELFKTVVRDGHILATEPYYAHDKIAETTFLRCFQYGWLHNEVLGRSGETTAAYVFPSPLHRWYVHWMLLGSPEEGAIQEQRPINFLIAVLRDLNLSTIRAFGQSAPGSQFRDEFYRMCTSYANGCVLSFPEFGIKGGRMDFFIPSKKWGIELLMDGNAESKRITAGEYEKWISQGKMDDYAIIDFRSNRPGNGCEELDKYYAVWDYGRQTAEVLNSKNEVVEQLGIVLGDTQLPQ